MKCTNNKGKGKAKAAGKKPKQDDDSSDESPPKYQKSSKAKASTFVSHLEDDDSDIDMSYYAATMLPVKGSPEPQCGRKATIRPIHVRSITLEPRTGCMTTKKPLQARLASPSDSSPEVSSSNNATSVAESTSDPYGIHHLPHHQEREMVAMELHIGFRQFTEEFGNANVTKIINGMQYFSCLSDSDLESAINRLIQGLPIDTQPIVGLSNKC